MSTKTIQGKLWSIQPQYWSNNFEPYFLPIYRKVLLELKLSWHDSVLDAGCGAGMFSSLVIKTGASLIGVDAAPGLLEVARRRNPGYTFMEEDLEALPFATDSFDVVAGFNSFQYAGSFENALKEAKRTLKPGGQLVIAIWDKPEMSDATKVLTAIAGLVPPPPPGSPSPFALSEEGKVESVLKSIGMQLEMKTMVMCPFVYPTLVDGVKSFMSTGPAANALNHADRSTIESTIQNALTPFHVVDNFYYLQNQFLLFIARK